MQRASSYPAPICLFTYARPQHASLVVNALKLSPLATSSILYVFSDAPKTDEAVSNVLDVREMLHSIDGFAEVKIVEREKNVGLARNIQEGVSEVIARHGRAIILEDDTVPSVQFLDYMNRALDKFETDPKVWHVSGYSHPIDATGLSDVYLSRFMNCWGWATWADRWAHYVKNPLELKATWSDEHIHRFNLDGKLPYWRQVEANISGEIDTWAIFWYATIFAEDGLCLNPTRSLVSNIGHDGTGENCGVSDLNFHATPDQNFRPNLDLPALQEDVEAIIRVKRYVRTEHRRPLVRMINRLSTQAFGRVVVP